MSHNRMAAAVVAAIAVALFAATYGFEQMPEGITRGFGAELFPRMVLGTILALAALLAFQSGTGEPLPRIPRMVWYSGAALLVFMVLLRVIGMLPAMFVLLVGVGWMWGERRRLLLLAASVLITLAIWGVFVKGFGVQLPKGLFA